MKPTRAEVVEQTDHSKLDSDARRPKKVVGTVMLFVHMSKAEVNAVFGVVKKLGLPLLVKKSFTDRVIKGIFHKSKA